MYPECISLFMFCYEKMAANCCHESAHFEQLFELKSKQVLQNLIGKQG